MVWVLGAVGGIAWAVAVVLLGGLTRMNSDAQRAEKRYRTRVMLSDTHAVLHTRSREGAPHA